MYMAAMHRKMEDQGDMGLAPGVHTDRPLEGPITTQCIACERSEGSEGTRDIQHQLCFHCRCITTDCPAVAVHHNLCITHLWSSPAIRFPCHCWQCRLPKT